MTVKQASQCLPSNRPVAFAQTVPAIHQALGRPEVVVAVAMLSAGLGFFRLASKRIWGDEAVSITLAKRNWGVSGGTSSARARET